MTTTDTASVAPVLRFLNITRVFEATPPVHALRRVNLTIDRGDYVAIMGPSGSGKSTLLNLAGLIDKPTSGTLELDGVDVATMSEATRTAMRAHRVGIVFQAFHLLPYRTALENVALAQLYSEAPRRQRLVRAARALHLVGLGHRIQALPTTLSGGEQQRVAIARALVNEPSLLLMDEPTGDLDSQMATEVTRVLDGLHARGYTIALITHDLGVGTRAQRLVTIRDGVLDEAEAP